MLQEIIMPKLGLTMTHGKIIKWLKNEGDQVKTGEAVVEIETDKISSEVESPMDGYIIKILAAEGEEREITAPIAVVGANKEQVTVQKTESKPDNCGIRISPIARKIAEENAIDYTNIKGTGPDGRIVKEDILAAIEEKDNSKTAQAQSTTGSADVAAYTVTHLKPAAEEKKMPLSGIRKIIAQKLWQSKHDIPHVYFKIVVDASRIIELKNRIGEMVKAGTGKKLSINEIVIKAAAAALKEFPDINVSLINDEIIYHNDINIGMAVSLDNGLVVPVIKNADTLGFAELNKFTGELIDKARGGKLTPDDITGGTFTVSNLGAFGIDEFLAIINPPESAILAVGRAVNTPIAENGQVVIKPMMALTLSVDHRVIDGALAAQYMKKLKGLLEDPYLLLV